jgi:hypothetical protein
MGRRSGVVRLYGRIREKGGDKAVDETTSYRVVIIDSGVVWLHIGAGKK